MKKELAETKKKLAEEQEKNKRMEAQMKIARDALDLIKPLQSLKKN